MVWPVDREPSRRDVPPGYALRVYREGDDLPYIRLMRRAGFSRWGERELAITLRKALPGGIFFLCEATGDEPVATACAVHSADGDHPFGGEMGWVAVVPEHRGRKLGRIVCALVIERFLAAGFRHIYLKTDDFRRPALRMYLAQGWQPYILEKEMDGRWEKILKALGIPDDSVSRVYPGERKEWIYGEEKGENEEGV